MDRIANGILLYYIIANYSDDAEKLRYIIAGVPVFCGIGTYSLTYIGQKYYGPDNSKDIYQSII
jgi:hypothetical protein